MITQDDQDRDDFGLPSYVVKQAASELIIKYLMPEIEAFMSMAIDALAHDCEIDNEEAAAILWAKVGSMAKGLKLNQWTVNHAAIYFRSWQLFDEAENAAPLQLNSSPAIWRPIEADKPAYNVDNDYNVGGIDNSDEDDTEGGELTPAA